MKKTIREMLNNKKQLQKTLKKEISILKRMDKYPPRFYAYLSMLQIINLRAFFESIYNSEILDYELEVVENDIYSY